ncbi:MAG: lipoyl synthase [Candidatus Margulisiibacteriota bacterium]
MPLPSFLIKKIPKQENIRRLRALINNPQIHTVCEEAKCPNIGECFSKRTCTFMILGSICTRACSFCGVNHGKPCPPDPKEPIHIAEAVKKLKLSYVVITSVTRDDLPDGGAAHFARVIQELLATNQQLLVEVLIPDFQGREKDLKTVLEAKPYVLNHNLETIPRLYSKIRPQASYERSLKLLYKAKQINPKVITKSGLMVGLGERKEEVFKVIEDLKKAKCDLMTIGQYLPPSKSHPKQKRYVLPKEYEEYKIFGKNLGLKIFAGPFIRSSYVRSGPTHDRP